MPIPQGPLSIAQENLRGKIERLEGAVLVGWLFDPQQPEGRVAFDLAVNGTEAGRHEAALPRGDLLRAGIGDGAHAFRVAVPPDSLRDGPNEFALRFPAGQREIALIFDADPAALPRAAAPPAPRRVPGTAEVAAALGLPAQAPPPPPPAPMALPGVTAVPAPAAAPPPVPTAPLPWTVQEAVARLGAGDERCARIAALLAARDWPAAAEAAAAGPRDARSVVALGVALLELGRAEEAEGALRWLEEHAAADHAGLFRLGAALEAQQRHVDAAAIYGRCRALKPSEPRYVLQCGRMVALAANGGHGVAPEHPELLGRAIALLREAADLMPRDGRPPRELAVLLFQAGETEAALEAILEAERREPTRGAYALERARILTRLDRVEEALAAARRAIELGPRSDGALAMLRVLERWAAARGAGPWRVAALDVPMAEAP